MANISVRFLRKQASKQASKPLPHTARRAAPALLALSVGSAMHGCTKPGDATIPPTPVGPLGADLEIRDRGNLIFTHALTAPEIALGSGELGSVPAASLRDVNTGQNVVRVRYHSPNGGVYAFPGGTFAHEYALDLFVRDPAEYLATLKSTANIRPDAWRRLVMTSTRAYPTGEQWWGAESPWFLPAAVTTSFVGQYPATYNDAFVLPSLFWGANVDPSPSHQLFPTSQPSWGAPGSNPSGWGSIKALRAAEHGMCEVEVPVQEILDNFRIGFTRGIRKGCGATFFCGILENSKLESLSASTYLMPKRDLTGAGFAPGYDGGFLVRAHVHWDMTAFCPFVPHGSCESVMLADERWDMGGPPYGLPRISPQQLLGSPTGDHDCINALGAEMDKVFGKGGEIERAFAAEVAGRTRIPITSAATDAGPGTPIPCANGGTPQASCLTAATTLLAAAQIGAAKLFGGNVPPSLQNALTLAVQDGAGQPDGSRNWECIPRFHPLPGAPCTPLAQPDYICHFIARAKRMIVNPDALDLVLFDTVDDADAGRAFPGVVLFFAALGAGRDWREACSRRWLAGDSWARYYATVHQKKNTCKDPGPRPPDLCCNTDSDCNIGFNTGLCDPVLHRCFGEGCSSNDDCYGFERCIGQVCVAYPSFGCDVRDPFGTLAPACPPKTVCEPRRPIVPWVEIPPDAQGGECRSL